MKHSSEQQKAVNKAVTYMSILRGTYVAYNRIDIHVYVTALFTILFQVQVDPFGSNGPASWPILTEFRTDSISLVEESPKMKKQYCFGMYTQVVGDLYHGLLGTKNSGVVINNRCRKFQFS